MAKKLTSIGWLAAMLLCGNLLFATPQIKIIVSTPPHGGGVMRSIARPLIALYDNTVGALELLFNANLGVVAVDVTGETGTVHYNTCQASAGELYSISTEEWELGTYTLSVVLSSGATYTWEFELVEEDE